MTGFTVDIVRELAKRMDFDYEFVVLRSGGSKNFVKALKQKVGLGSLQQQDRKLTSSL